MTGNDAIFAAATTEELLMARQRLDLHLRRQTSCGEALCNTKHEQGHVLSLELDYFTTFESHAGVSDHTSAFKVAG